MKATMIEQGFEVQRHFTKEGINPLDEVHYIDRDCTISDPDGTIIFEMKGAKVPESWSQLASDILLSKYFKRAGVPESGKETHVRQVVHRIANTIRIAAEELGYIRNEVADIFEAELSFLLVHQRAAFNSPVWFNVGLWHQYGIRNNGGNFYCDRTDNTIKVTTDAYSHPQASACFIQSLDDDLMAIFDLIRAEARLFKHGSGTGTNFSNLRSCYETLSGGGTSSGLMSFLKILDRSADAVKSGGITRRAAKMVCLDMDHPEIVDFIEWKVKEEAKVQALLAAGYSSDFNGEAYKTVSGQNSNNSVRLSDEFMNAVLQNTEWKTLSRKTGKPVHTYKARELMDKISQAAWACADPGVQFDTIINKWHTCPNSGPIRASNPCSEYMFLDDSACNLSSVNIMQFALPDGTLDIEGFQHACRVMFFAQEVLVGLSSYPTAKIARNSADYRPLGLGYANLGTYLMINGVPYDSEKGRAIAGAITAILCGTAYKTSAEIAQHMGPFAGFAANKEPMLRVMKMHRDAAYTIDIRHCAQSLLQSAREVWDQVVDLGEKHGYRNAQATVLAPTGTIGLLMDCDTTGVEPEFSLVKWKKLAGGGHFKIINKSIRRALAHLGYTSDQIHAISTYILGTGTFVGSTTASAQQLNALGFSEAEIAEAESHVQSTKDFNEWTPHVNPKTLAAKGMNREQIKAIQIHIGGAQTIEGAPHVRREHYDVFNCANKCGEGTQFIPPMGHVKMMAAVQPFISGAISKTVNIPNDATVQDIEQIYLEAWKMGPKAIALYRDGCKLSQPLNTSSSTEIETESAILKQLPKKRIGRCIQSTVAGHEITLRTGEFSDGTLGDVSIQMHKPGSTMNGMMAALATTVSLGLQNGVPLEKYVDALTFSRFEPSGFADHDNVKSCTSLVDFVFRVLALEYLDRTDIVQVAPEAQINSMRDQLSTMMGDAPACNECGHITVRNGSCYKCLNCGNSLGCS